MVCDSLGLGLVGFLAVMGLVGLIGGIFGGLLLYLRNRRARHTRPDGFLPQSRCQPGGIGSRPTDCDVPDTRGRPILRSREARTDRRCERRGRRGEVLFDMTALVTSEANEQGAPQRYPGPPICRDVLALRVLHRRIRRLSLGVRSRFESKTTRLTSTRGRGASSWRYPRIGRGINRGRLCSTPAEPSGFP